MGPSPVSPNIRSARQDVLTHRSEFFLYRGQQIFDDVAGRHDPGEPAKLNDRDLPAVINSMISLTLMVSVQLTTLRVIVRSTPSSSAAAPRSASARTMSRSDTMPAPRCAIHHHQGANPTFGEHPDRGFETGSRPDGGDVATLERQNRLDGHVINPPQHCAEYVLVPACRSQRRYKRVPGGVSRGFPNCSG